MPGTSVAEAAAIVAGELTQFPHLPELPARGPGADMVGRTAALLVGVAEDLGVETIPTGWRIVGGVTREVRRAGSWLGEDLDKAEEVFGSSDGFFKVQICGPWTLAAMIETPTGGPALRDPGLVAELGAALAVAAAAHMDEASRRLPGRRVVLQVDEPALPAVLDGRIPTASGFGRISSVSAGEAAALLRPLVSIVGHNGVLHCCDNYPFAVAAAAGFGSVSWDLDRWSGDADVVAEAAESGTRLMMGAVPTSGAATVDRNWDRVRELWRRTGLAPTGLGEVAFSPSCGLAGSSLPAARAALTQAVELAHRSRQEG